MKNKLKQLITEKKDRSSVPKGIRPFTVHPSNHHTNQKVAFDLFAQFTADIMKEKKLFIR